MILALDTYYFDDKARTVGLLFREWTDEYPQRILSEVIESVEPYQSGEFYKRELPCIISLLNTVDLNDISTIVIDGFVVLNDAGKPGLGAHLYAYLKQQISVIGVAKTNFALNTKIKREVCRGQSIKPLYITALGIDLSIAATNIKNMHGPHRIPTLLKQLDGLTRGINALRSEGQNNLNS